MADGKIDDKDIKEFLNILDQDKRFKNLITPELRTDLETQLINFSDEMDVGVNSVSRYESDKDEAYRDGYDCGREDGREEGREEAVAEFEEKHEQKILVLVNKRVREYTSELDHKMQLQLTVARDELQKQLNSQMESLRANEKNLLQQIADLKKEILATKMAYLKGDL